MNDQGIILHATAIIRDAKHQLQSFGTQAAYRKIGHVHILALHDDPVLLFQGSSYVANITVMKTKGSIKAFESSCTNKVHFSVALFGTEISSNLFFVLFCFFKLEIWNCNPTIK